MARKTAFVGFSYLTGLLLASFLSLWLTFAAAGALLGFGICVFLIFRPENGSRLYRTAVCAAACSAGLFLYGGYDIALCHRIEQNNGMSFSGSVTVEEVSVYSENSAFYIGSCTFPNGMRGKTGFYSKNPDLVRGDSITLSGVLYAPSDSGTQSSAEHYRSMNVFLLIDVYDESDHIINESGIFRIIDDFRSDVCERIRKYVPSEEGEMIIGMIFGSGYMDLSYKTERLLYRAGIGHVTAVSGMHLSIAAGIAAAAANAAGMGRKSRFAAVMGISFIFAAAAGFSPSVIRALIAAAAVWSAGIFNRKSDSLTSLAIAAVIMTAFSPFSARNVSFLLSLSGTLGTAVLAPALIEELERYKSKKYGENYRMGAFFSSVCTALCAGAAVFPVSALSFDEISVISPVTNVILSPLFTLAVTLSILGAAACLLPFSFIGGGLFLAAGAVCKPIIYIAELLGKIPFAAIPAGLEIVKPMLLLIILSVSAGAVIISDRMYSVLLCLLSVLISVCCISVYRLVPSGVTEISVLTEGNGCSVIVKNDSASQIFDFMGTRRGVRTAAKELARSGASETVFAVITENCAFTESVFSEIFDNITVISPLTKSGLTYSAEENIIKLGGCEYYPHNGFDIIETEGIRIICITGKCTPPDMEYDLCIICCKNDINVKADRYLVADSGFEGRLSPLAETVSCENAAYIADNGAFYPKEDTAWLR